MPIRANTLAKKQNSEANVIANNAFKNKTIAPAVEGIEVAGTN
jgi:hypothetical protein